MPEWQLTTPVAFLVFNRPETTQRVFDEIRRARPQRLLVVADGPRLDRPHDERLCQETRSIAAHVDWPCEVLTHYSDINLGCRDGPASGIDWVFSRVEEAIILEDDCIPERSFFRFCCELLERYRGDRRIGTIVGTNLQAGKKRGDASYYFSKYPAIWGWATWRRTWALYDRAASVWPEFFRSGAFQAVTESAERIHWQAAFNNVHHSGLDAWDYQLALTCWSQNMLSIVPNHNLISNIGFGPDATHTQSPGATTNLPRQPMSFPLVHPRLVVADSKADAFVAKRIFGESLRSRLGRYVRLARRGPHSPPAGGTAPDTSG